MSLVWSKEEDGTIYANVCGTLPRDPEIRETNKGTTMVKFSVRAASKLYMSCVCFGGDDDPVKNTAGMLEAGDIVLVCGKLVGKEYNGKHYEDLFPDGIFVMPPVASGAQDGGA